MIIKTVTFSRTRFFSASVALLFATTAFSLFTSESFARQSAVKATEKTASSKKQEFASGTVFLDKNNNGKFDKGDGIFSGARVSNGREIVQTDNQGKYKIPLDDGQILFVIKPSGFRTRLSKDNLPRFYYNHRQSAAPKLTYPGIDPTGPLPESIDFPLYEQKESQKFKAILFGDPQPRNLKEVAYIAKDVVPELIGSDASFGVTLGDIVFDDLSCMEPLSRAIGFIGIPWYNVIGNHDINLDAKNRKQASTTFNKIYGPNYYSFDHGPVHFVVMDNIDYHTPTPQDKRKWKPTFGTRQLEFLKNDLALVGEDKLVVLMMHVPLTGVTDRDSVYKLIEKRPFCISISGHTHYHAHRFIGKKEGFNGKKPHHHIINVTVSGSWWGGKKDERGIPHTTMTDGGPNGHSVISFDGTKYQLDFVPAGRPKSYQMNLTMPEFLVEGEVSKKKLVANVFNGAAMDKVEARIGADGQWVPMKNYTGIAPKFKELFDREIGPDGRPIISRPRPTNHLWRLSMKKLGAGKLAPGQYLVQVRWTDRNNRITTSNRVLFVSNKKEVETQKVSK